MRRTARAATCRVTLVAAALLAGCAADDLSLESDASSVVDAVEGADVRGAVDAGASASDVPRADAVAPRLDASSADHADGARADGADAHAVVDAAAASDVAASCAATAAVCDRTVYDRAQAYAAAHPLRDGASWAGWCASLMWRFGALPESSARPSAIDAYHASSIVSTDPSTARIGAFHWWDIGVDGHVGTDLLGGGTTVFMASTHLAASWGTAIGVNSVSAYGATARSARYLGWSMDYAGGTIAGGGGAACVAGGLVPVGCAVPKTGTEQSGAPDVDFWMRLQLFAAANGYGGPIDGVMGVSAWAGVQRGLRSAGYTGPDDGVPGVNTFMAMQRIAAMYGYTGPVDGALGPNSYRGFAAFLNRTYDGVRR